jgi:hypothetical protein
MLTASSLLIVTSGVSYCQTTVTGFHYPIGTASPVVIGSFGGTAYTGTGWHCGADLSAKVGDPVYAVSDGDVVSISTGGWGTDNVGLIVKHRCSNGRYFLAVYGHIRDYSAGHISAGQQIGTIGPWAYGSHLHFGIYESADGSGAWPYIGTGNGWGIRSFPLPPAQMIDGVLSYDCWMDPIAYIRLRVPWSGELAVGRRIDGTTNTEVCRHWTLHGGEATFGVPTTWLRLSNTSPNGSQSENQVFSKPGLITSVYWPSEWARAGTFCIWGDIAGAYLAIGGHGSVIGVPTSCQGPSDRSPYGQDSVNATFEQGLITSVSAVSSPYAVQGTFVTVGDIYRKYVSMFGHGGVLGVPTSSELESSLSPYGQDSVNATFERGLITSVSAVSSPYARQGTFAVWGDIYDKYCSLGGHGSVLGVPTRDQSDPQGPNAFGTWYVVAEFEYGLIVHSPTFGTTFYVPGCADDADSMAAQYMNAGGPGVLGVPLSDPYAWEGVTTRQDFEGGSLYSNRPPLAWYLLSLTSSGGGRVKADGIEHSLPWSCSYAEGASVMLEAVPAPGYAFIAWSGDLAGSTSPTTLTIDADKAVTVEFLATPHFTDVTEDSWAYDEIEACLAAGIVQGYPDNTYQPANPVTRDQMAVYTARAVAGGDGSVPPGPVTATFADVPTDHWAYRYVEYAVSHGVVQGYDPTHYRPDEAVDRGQMAVYVARARGWVRIGEDMTTAPELFPDVPAGFWAGTAIKACVEHDVVHGYDDGYYHPDWTVTRDQMAVYVQRAFGLGM